MPRIKEKFAESVIGGQGAAGLKPPQGDYKSPLLAGALLPVSYSCFMRSFRALLLLLLTPAFAVGEEVALTDAQEQFRRELGRFKANAAAVAGPDGWLFLASELRLLTRGRFWGDAAVKSGRERAASADPIPAITDFQRQLRERGIELLLVPVPPRATVYPEKLVAKAPPSGAEAAPYLQSFYEELRGRGVDVLDLTSLFVQHREHARGPVFCRTDSHWSGVGCMLAAQAIAERVQSKIAASARKEYATDWKEVSITGDLAGLVASGSAKATTERIAVRTVSEKAGGGAVQPDAHSPILLLGDSHTLVFREFLSERAGLVDQLAKELGSAPDLIGTRGSGATAVRISLYRRTRSDPNYLAKKKVVVWCFAAREFTESDQGWVPQPIAK